MENGRIGAGLAGLAAHTGLQSGFHTVDSGQDSRTDVHHSCQVNRGEDK